MSFAQDDSLVLSFSPNDKELSAAHIQQLDKKINKRRLDKIIIQAYIADNATTAKNRINVLYRLHSLKEHFHANAIYDNLITEQQIITKDSALFHKIKIAFYFIQAKKGKVVFKTATVQISEDQGKLKPRTKKTVIDTVVKQKPIIREQKKIVKTPPKKKTYGVLKIKDFKKGQTIVIPKLYFEATRHTLRRTSYQSLRDLLAILKDKPSMKVRLQGHICCKMNGKDGMDFTTHTPNLSENRAKAVCEFLIRNGIAPNRLSYIGFGSKYKLVEDNGSAIKGLKNRRVEVYVVSE